MERPFYFHRTSVLGRCGRHVLGNRSSRPLELCEVKYRGNHDIASRGRSSPDVWFMAQRRVGAASAQTPWVAPQAEKARKSVLPWPQGPGRRRRGGGVEPEARRLDLSKSAVGVRW